MRKVNICVIKIKGKEEIFEVEEAREIYRQLSYYFGVLSEPKKIILEKKKKKDK